MKQELISIPKVEYKELRMKAELNDELLFKLVKGLEDVRNGKVKLWKKTFLA